MFYVHFTFHFMYKSEPPEVSVIQLGNGSLLCNASGFPDNISYSRWEHKSPEQKHLRYLDGTERGILNFHTLDRTRLDTTYSSDGIYICKVVNHMAKDGDKNFQTGFANVLFKGNNISSKYVCNSFTKLTLLLISFR